MEKEESKFMGWAAISGILCVAAFFAYLGILGFQKSQLLSSVCEVSVRPFSQSLTEEGQKMCTEAKTKGITSKSEQEWTKYKFIAAFITASPAFSNIWEHKIRSKFKKSEK